MFFGPGLPGVIPVNGPRVVRPGHSSPDASQPALPMITVSRAEAPVPASWMYPSFDNRLINPYNFGYEDFLDTIRLLIIAPGECGFTMPSAGKITSRFGYRHYRLHKGTDIDLRTGDPVYAAFDGKVRIARYSPSFGWLVVIRHYNGLESLYAHLSRLLVQPGDMVSSGQIIGKGGSTGRSTGSHLHFELRYKGLPFNPELLIDFESGALRTHFLLLTPADFRYVLPASVYYSYFPAG